MSKLSDALRAHRIINTSDLLKAFGVKGQDVAIMYHTRQPRGAGAPQSVVYSPSHKTNPQSAWYDYGQKAFVGNRADSMPLAIAWASKVYGVKEWATCPTDPTSKVPQYVRDAAEEFAKSQKMTVNAPRP